MAKTDKSLLKIVSVYHDPLVRMAKLRLHNKALAVEIVKFVFEELYQEQVFYEGEHLRPLLIQRINSACNLANRLHIQGYSTGTPLYHPIMMQ